MKLENKLDGTWRMYGEMEGAWDILVRKLAGKNRLIWKDNIKIDLKEIQDEGEDWIQLAQDRSQWWVLVNTVTNIGVL
jgi:hypothetical protein